MELTQPMIRQINLIQNAFSPVVQAIPDFQPLINIPVFPRKNQQNQFILNPITNNYVQNVQPNRYRIKKQIEQINIKRTESNNKRDEIINNNSLLNKYSSTSNVKDIFSNYARLYVNLQNINSLEEFYNTVKEIIQRSRQDLVNKYVISNITLWWFNDSNKALIRSINTSFFDKRATYQQFEEEITRLQQGLSQNPGSEPIDSNEYKFSFNRFGVFLKKLVGDSPIKNIFKIVGINSNGRCFMDCLQHLDLIPKGVDFYKDYDNFIKFVKNNNIAINIVSNIINKIDLNNIEDEDLFNPIIEGKAKKIIVYKLNKNRITPNYLYRDEAAENTLLYNPLDNHIDIIENNNISLCDDIYVSTDGNIYKGNSEVVSKLYSVSDIYKHTSNKKDIINEVKYVCFDYETVLDWDDENVMKPYSISWSIFTHTELIEIVDKEINENNDILMKLLRDKSRCFNYVGYDASEIFIKWILENQQYTIFKFISFNGANFDNIILLRALLQLRQENTHNKDDLNISDIQYNNNQLLNFKLNGRHSCFDLRKHLIGSLNDNCISFKVPKEFCKLTFNHNETQHKYNSFNNKNDFIVDMKKQDEL